MSVKERLRLFIKSELGSVSAFEKSINASNGYVNSISKSIGLSKFQSILEKYPNLNTNWLITGKGDMLKEEFKETTPYIVSEPTVSYETGVPYFDIDFVGGFDLLLNNQTMTPSYLIDFKEYNKADCWCNVTGHSMEPEITHGDIIALKEVKDWHLFIPFGEVYAIVTKNNMRTIKRVVCGGKKDFLKLVPTNKSEEYGVQEIPKSIIYKVYSVLGCMKKL